MITIEEVKNKKLTRRIGLYKKPRIPKKKMT